MDLDQRLAISYYKPIAAINEPHHVYLAPGDKKDCHQKSA